MDGLGRGERGGLNELLYAQGGLLDGKDWVEQMGGVGGVGGWVVDVPSKASTIRAPSSRPMGRRLRALNMMPCLGGWVGGRRRTTREKN